MKGLGSNARRTRAMTRGGHDVVAAELLFSRAATRIPQFAPSTVSQVSQVCII